MAVRNLQGINNVQLSMENSKQLKVEEVKNQLSFYNNYILEMSNDIVDVLDTFKYCKENGLKNIVDKYSKTFKAIGIKDDCLFLQFNNWKNDNSGPYDWFVYTNGSVVWVKVNNDASDVPTMITYTKYNEKVNFVVAPIISGNYYVCHNASTPLAVLKMFVDKLKPFIATFFNDIDNLG